MSAQNETTNQVVKHEKEWRNLLTEQQYHVLFEKGTERAFSGKYNDFKEKGVFKCAACNQNLFLSNHKFDSGSGWPSFYDVYNNKSINIITDKSHGMIRSEVVCSNCGGHLGHVFDDGPKEKTGLRYCINSASLTFEKK